MNLNRPVKLQLMKYEDLPLSSRRQYEQLTRLQQKATFLCVTAPQCTVSMAYNQFLDEVKPPKGTPGYMIMRQETWIREFGREAIEPFLKSMKTKGHPCMEHVMYVTQTPEGIQMSPKGPTAAESADKRPSPKEMQACAKACVTKAMQPKEDMEEVPSPDKQASSSTDGQQPARPGFHEILYPVAKAKAEKEARTANRNKVDHDIMMDILERAIDEGAAMNPH